MKEKIDTWQVEGGEAEYAKYKAKIEAAKRKRDADPQNKEAKAKDEELLPLANSAAAAEEEMEAAPSEQDDQMEGEGAFLGTFMEEDAAETAVPGPAEGEILEALEEIFVEDEHPAVSADTPVKSSAGAAEEKSSKDHSGMSFLGTSPPSARADDRGRVQSWLKASLPIRNVRTFSPNAFIFGQFSRRLFFFGETRATPKNIISRPKQQQSAIQEKCPTAREGGGNF